MANNHLLTGDGLATAWRKMKTLIHSYISEATANKLTGARMASVSDGYRLLFGRSSGTTDEFTIPLSDKTTRAGLIKTTSTVTSGNGYTPCPVINGVPYFTFARYSEVTKTSSGLATPAMYQAVEGSVNSISRTGVTLTLQKNNGTTSSVTLPNAATNVTGVVKTTSTVKSVSSADGYAACPIISGVPYYKETTYPTATVTKAGLMSKTQAAKLERIGSYTSNEATTTGFKSKSDWVKSVSLSTPAGTSLVFVTVYFDSDSTGKRGVAVSTKSADKGTVLRRAVVDASKTGDTYVNLVVPIDLSSTTTLYINTYSTNTTNTISAHVHYATVYLGQA